MLQITLFYLLALATGSFAAVAGRLSDGDSETSLATVEKSGTPTCVLPGVPPINLTPSSQPSNSIAPPDAICEFLCPVQQPCPKGSGPPKCIDPVPHPSPTTSSTTSGTSLRTRNRNNGIASPTQPPVNTEKDYQKTGNVRRNRQDQAEITCPDYELPCPKECPKSCIRSKAGPCPNTNKPTCPHYCPKIVVPCPKECPTKESGCVRPQGVLCPYAVEPTCKPTVTITVDPANPTFCPLVIRPCPEKCPDSCMRPVGAPCPNIYPPWCPEDSSISVSATTVTLSTPSA
ncbi:hypothetical protein INT44_000833 [Umbelopsis vinacea]|uniref:Uncharacterized protein n=1 Tax=Umbelopsis vinacea TaxID=44442 RepID=A0A8H7Q8R0_9FUNG|nr:hypothetical protein INT44_000833 [Umbelopsis vinacea]